MSLTVTQRPLTNYIAVKNPCLYKFSRQDFALTSITAGSPNVTVVISGDVTASILVGHTVIIFTTDLTQQRTGVVTSSTFAAGNTTVVFLNSGANIGSIGTGYLNNLSRFNYRAEIEVYTSPSNTLIGTLSYSPDKSGLVKADVSTIVKNALSPDITSTTVSHYTWLQDSAISSFYIKYREVWTGFTGGQTDDVANIRNAVYAANQVGESDNALSYPSLLGFIYAAWKGGLNFFTYLNNNTANLYLKLSNGVAGNKIAFYVPIDQYTGLRNFAWKAFVNSFVGQNGSAPEVLWTVLNKSSYQVVLTAGQTSYFARQIIRANNTSFNFNYTLSMFAGVGTAQLQFLVYSEALVVLRDIRINIDYAAGTVSGSVTINEAAIVKIIDCKIITSSATQTMQLSTSIDIFDSQLDASLVTISGSPLVDTNYPVIFRGSEILLPKVQVKNDCSNEFNVVWRNRFGGLSNFIFQHNQLFSWRFKDQYKAKEFVLYADQLTDAHIEQLEDLNQVGELYSVAYDELPTNVIQKRIGTQVYKCDTDGKLTGITVTPTSNSYKTLFSRSRAKITVELPETIY